MNKLINNLKKFKKNYNLILTIYICINVLYLLVGMILKEIKIFNYEKFSYGLVVGAVINFLLIIVLFIKKKYKKNLIDIFILSSIICATISCELAINPKDAFLGNFVRHEGLLQIIYYFTLMFLSSFINNKNKKIVVNIIIFTGLVQALYALYDVLIVYRLNGKINTEFNTSNAFTTHSNFLSTYILMCICLSIGMYLNTNKKSYLYFYIILIMGLLISNTMSGIVGIFVAFIFITIYLISQKRIKEIFIIILPFIILLLFFHFNKCTSLLENIIKTNDEIKEIAQGNFDDAYGTHRLLIWKNTIKIVPTYIIHGCGMDNFLNAFPNGHLTFGYYIYDRAHNEFLNLLVCEGIFSLISYVSILIILFFRNIKNFFKDKKINIYLIILVAYVTQSMFNIRVIEVAPIFYILIGFMINRTKRI